MESKIVTANENKTRSSNIELFRIISMFLIVAHHYVINSGLFDLIKLSPTSGNSIFLLILGAWGKTGINCFMMITGYFMCTSKITLKKYIKLLLEVMLYKVIIYIILAICGYETVSLLRIVKLILPVTSVETNFTGCFLLFYLCIPFLNILVKNLTEKKHLLLILLSGVIYVFFGTVPKLGVLMNYVSWFIVLYFIASYVRLYQRKIFEKTALWGILSLLFLGLSVASILVCIFVGPRIGIEFSPYLFVQDSNTFLALATGFSLFMFFKNLKIKDSKFINLISSATFGVLLIHASSDAMRTWLWEDTFKNCEYFNSNYLALHALLTVVIVYAACTLIDIIRQKIIEKPFMKLWDKIEPKISNFFGKIYEKLKTKFNIGE